MKTVAIFPYFSAPDPDFGDVSVPVITVTFIRRMTQLTLDFLLDSGADVTILPYRFGKRLGLRSHGERPLELSGEGGGTVPAIVRRVGLRIGTSRTIPVRVGWAQTDAVSLLLGRLDVFDHFTFELDHVKQEVRVKQ